MKVLRMMLQQAWVDEIIPKNPALAVRRLLQGITDVDPFTVEAREAIIAGFHRYAPHLGQLGYLWVLDRLAPQGGWRLEVGEGGLPAGQDPDSGGAGVGAETGWPGCCGAPEPGGDPGEVQSLCAESDPD